MMKFLVNVKNSNRTYISLLNHTFRHFKSVSGNTLYKSNSEKIASLQKWIEMCRYFGEKVPSNVTQSQMNYMLNLPTEGQKKKYLFTLFIKEINIEKDKDTKLEKEKIKLSENERRRRLRTSGHIKYGLWNNSMFMRISKQAAANLKYQKLISSMIHGQTIILDFFHGNNLTNIKEKNIILNETVSICKTNCKSIDPFNLIFFNAELNSENLKNIKNRLSSSFPLQIYENNYIDYFPKDKLIYLTPDSRYHMKYMDPDAVYIIGAIADYGKEQPLTLAKAKREGIKHQRLPLDRYCNFISNNVTNTFKKFILGQFKNHIRL